jgi:hypothetical protein
MVPGSRVEAGHNSKAVHHAYSKHAEVTVPSLDDWEKQWNRRAEDGGRRTDDAMPKPKVVPVDFQGEESLIGEHRLANGGSGSGGA